MNNKPKTKIKENEQLYIEKYQKYLTSYKAKKISLNKIIKNKEHINKITNTSVILNKIITHTYHFIKLYMLYNWEKNKELPVLDTKLVKCIFKIIGTKKNCGKSSKPENLELQNILQDFFDTHYKDIIKEDREKELCYTGLSNVLEYEATSIITNFENHIRNHFIDFLNKYIDIKFGVKKYKNMIYGNRREIAINIEKYIKAINENPKLKNVYGIMIKYEQDKLNILPDEHKKLFVDLYIKRANKIKNDIIYGYDNCLLEDKMFRNTIIKDILPAQFSLKIRMILMDKLL